MVKSGSGGDFTREVDMHASVWGQAAEHIVTQDELRGSLRNVETGVNVIGGIIDDMPCDRTVTHEIECGLIPRVILSIWILRERVNVVDKIPDVVMVYDSRRCYDISRGAKTY